MSAINELVEFKAMQIAKAKEMGKDGFDEERFIKPRPVKDGVEKEGA